MLSGRWCGYWSSRPDSNKLHLVKDQLLARLFDLSTFLCSLGIAALMIILTLCLVLCQSIDGMGIPTMWMQECAFCLALGWRSGREMSWNEEQVGARYSGAFISRAGADVCLIAWWIRETFVGDIFNPGKMV